MTFNDLTDFLQNKMSMRHIYQPLLIKSLVETGGVATIRQLSQTFFSQDESQLQYYEKRIKEMPSDGNLSNPSAQGKNRPDLIFQIYDSKITSNRLLKLRPVCI